jgi:prepilin-type N-terminal cleavage/methylation domain-containing protein
MNFRGRQKKSEGAFFKRICGFTLIELLVATALLSIVMTSVYSLTHASLRTWNFSEGDTDPYFEARNAMTLFSHEYNNIVGRAGHLFEGDDKEIVMFVVAQPMDLKQGEGRRLMRVIYSFNRNKKTLEREEALVETALPKRPLDESEVDRSRVKLSREYKTTVAENVERFKITYIWAPLPEDQPPDTPPVEVPPLYMDRHQMLWGLPQGIRVELALRDPETREENYSLNVTLPMYAPTVRAKREQLEEIFDVSS